MLRSATQPDTLSRLRAPALRRFAQGAAVMVGLLLAACGDDEGSAANGAAPASGGGTNLAEQALAKENPLGDVTMGDPDAPITFVEYASYTCHHCATFHAENLPKLKEQYIDTGKVYYVFREYPLDPVATAASMLTRCVAEDRYFQFADVLFKRQAQWAFVQDPRQGLEDIARQGGISSSQFEACITDQEVLDGLREIQRHASEEVKVEATPTLLINDEKVDGNLPWPALEEILTKNLPQEAESADQEG